MQTTLPMIGRNTSISRKANMPDIQIVKMDQGGANARILAKETKADFRRVEAASLKMPVSFASAEGAMSRSLLNAAG